MATISMFHAQNRILQIEGVMFSGVTTSYWTAALDNWVVISYYPGHWSSTPHNLTTANINPVLNSRMNALISNNNGLTFRPVNFYLPAICGGSSYSSTFSLNSTIKNVKLYNISGNYFLCGMSYYDESNNEPAVSRLIWYVNVKYAYDNYTDTTNVMGFNSINPQQIGRFHTSNPDLDFGVLNSKFYFFTVNGSLSFYTDLNTKSIEMGDNNTSENNCSIAVSDNFATMSNKKWILHGILNPSSNMSFSRATEYLTAGNQHYAKTIALSKFSCVPTGNNLYNTSYTGSHLTIASNDVISSNYGVMSNNQTSYTPCFELVTSQYNTSSSNWIDTRYNILILKPSTIVSGWHDIYRTSKNFHAIMGKMIMVDNEWVYFTCKFTVDLINSGNTTRHISCLVKVKLQTPAYINIGGANDIYVNKDYSYTNTLLYTNYSYYGNMTSTNPTLFGRIVHTYPELTGNNVSYSDIDFIWTPTFTRIRDLSATSVNNVYLSTVEGIYHTSKGFEN